MKEIEARTIVGKEHWEEFLEWMEGQTVGIRCCGAKTVIEKWGGRSLCSKCEKRV